LKKLLHIKNQKGQSALEYTVYMMIILAAFLSMQTYFKRGVQGRFKQAIDDMGDQYDPRVAESNIVTTSIGERQTIMTVVEKEDGGQQTDRQDLESGTETKVGVVVLPD